MLHLSSERLAELADVDPTPDEADHLRLCAECETEREAHRRLLTLAAGARHRIDQPLSQWEPIAERLRGEGIIRTSWSARPALRVALRVAAGLVLVAGGTAFGRFSAGASVVPSRADSTSFEGATNVSFDGSTDDPSIGYRSPAEAMAAADAAERQYARAVQFLQAHDTTAASPQATELYQTRLAALDEIAQASRQAIYAAPADPLVYRYYQSANAAREATIRQLGTVLPVGTRISRF